MFLFLAVLLLPGWYHSGLLSLTSLSGSYFSSFEFIESLCFRIEAIDITSSASIALKQPFQRQEESSRCILKLAYVTQRVAEIEHWPMHNVHPLLLLPVIGDVLFFSIGELVLVFWLLHERLLALYFHPLPEIQQYVARVLVFLFVQCINIVSTTESSSIRYPLHCRLFLITHRHMHSTQTHTHARTVYFIIYWKQQRRHCTHIQIFRTGLFKHGIFTYFINCHLDATFVWFLSFAGRCLECVQTKQGFILGLVSMCLWVKRVAQLTARIAAEFCIQSIVGETNVRFLILHSFLLFAKEYKLSIWNSSQKKKKTKKTKTKNKNTDFTSLQKPAYTRIYLIPYRQTVSYMQFKVVEKNQNRQQQQPDTFKYIARYLFISRKTTFFLPHINKNRTYATNIYVDAWTWTYGDVYMHLQYSVMPSTAQTGVYGLYVQ